VEFFSYRFSYIVLRGRWCNAIALNEHAPSEDKSDDSKGSFNEELEQVFCHIPKYRMKLLLGDFNSKSGEREYLQTDNWELESTSG
jgi:endonuclease/exonuclease/phosphatase family metal-dependent hydrolase